MEIRYGKLDILDSREYPSRYQESRKDVHLWDLFKPKAQLYLLDADVLGIKRFNA